MYIGLISPAKDPMGHAISDYYKQGKAGKLRVFSSRFDEDEIPVTQLFRPFEEFPELEKTAIEMASGRILDVGAGSGCHSLALQAAGKEVCAIDISSLSVDIMKQQGIKDVRLVNLFDEQFTGPFDTILMLMNGSGIIGKLEHMPAFFRKMKLLLAPGGAVLMDSSDLRFLFEEEDGSYLIDLAGDYYGEIDFRMKYKQIEGEPFDWLYIDFMTLSLYASENGFKAQLIQEGEHYDYLVRLTPDLNPTSKSSNS
ncbi:MAG: class I SAM-dependent methyltransferase [Tannerellaceae bacterium]|nr:class I SAM-dependent methyltransferase [Tannerellaceae bacterium]